MIRRVFWGWEQPVIDRAIALLTEKWQEGELDLGDALIIVPTAESGRRLKEALARFTAKQGGAVSAPHVWAPERALLTQTDRDLAASDSKSLLAWSKVLLEVDPASLPHLFPVLPSQPGWTWATEMGRALKDMATALGAGGKSFADVAAMDDLPMERERWQELARLEAAYHSLLSALETVDLQALKRQRAYAPELPEGVKRILVLPAPDLPLLFRRWLEAASSLVPVMIYVQAPAALEDQFDSFGAPYPACWGEKADLHIPLSEAQIHLEHDPAEQARRAMELARHYVSRQQIALAVCDPEVTAHLEEGLRQEEVAIYEPGGTPAGQHGTVQVLSLWAELIETDDWGAFAALLRVPEVRDRLTGVQGADGVRIIAEADDFATKRLPVTMAHAQELMPVYLANETKDDKRASAVSSLSKAMSEAHRIAGDFKSHIPLHEAARALLVILYGDHVYQTESPRHRDHVKICTDWLAQCEELYREAKLLRLSTDKLLPLSIDWLKNQRLTEPRGEIDLVLLGWLELLWETAPTLVVSGFNEEHVPGILISHPFLPDHLRQVLGIASQASRFARDAYLLSALAGQRAKNGHLHVVCGLWSEGKDTLRPSRLLFLCEDKALPARVRHLFPKDLESSLPRELPRQQAWKLKPSVADKREPLSKVSVSRLSAYLRCPFTYYLDYVLGMSGVDASKGEMDAMEYGNLIHSALITLQKDSGQAAGNDEAALRDLLLTTIEERAAALYGHRLPIPVEVQLESARQRLTTAAGIESGLRKAGWRTLFAELTLGGEEDKTPLLIEGARFNGRIDRVDRHPDGVTRIIDYKTGDKPLSPKAAHIKAAGKRAMAPEDEWKSFTGSDGSAYVWQDLQLPLYAKAWSLREKNPVQTAYWLLPLTVEEAALVAFEDLDETMIEAAMECASEAVRRINAGIFWPPAKGSRFDKYEDLFHGNIEEAVEWQQLLGSPPH